MFSTGIQLDHLFISGEIFNYDYCVFEEPDHGDDENDYSDEDCYGETNDSDHWCDEMDYDGPDGEHFRSDEQSDIARDRFGRRVIRSC
jgi:hypothetical protein